MITAAIRIVLASLVVLLLSEDARAQDPLAAARDLYHTAQYTEALSVLDRLTSEPAVVNDRQSVDLYRTLCLLAVGRRDEADRVMEAIIVRDPLYRPGDDLPPRTRIAFSDARRRVLPAIVQQHYANAKTTFDRNEFAAAATEFKRVLEALNDPDMGDAAKQPPLSDLLTLATGFYDLALKAIPPPPPPAPAAPEPAAPAAPAPPRIYGGEEPGVRAPVTISQEIPRFPGLVPVTGLKGIVEVVIDEKGSVESAVMVTPVATNYDKLVLKEAQTWQFSPATANGEPVKFRKRVQINIAPGRPKD
jgi:hypothetical protein